MESSKWGIIFQAMTSLKKIPFGNGVRLSS